jgi:hypothetical protein
MQLLNMDVELNGSHTRTRLGPLSPGLNAILGPHRAGKSSLHRWLSYLAAADAPVSEKTWERPADRTASCGLLEIANRGQRWTLGTARPGLMAYPRQGALSAFQREIITALAAAHGASDTEAALESLAARWGLHTNATSPEPQREQLLARQRDVDSRWQHLRQPETSRTSLLARRGELEAELVEAQQESTRHVRGAYALSSHSSALDPRRYAERCTAIEHDLRDTTGRMEALDRELAEVRGELKVLETTRATVTVDNSYRQQLQEIDDRLTRWRQTLRDLKAHRQRIEHDATDARLDKQVGEQLSITKEPDPRAALRSLEAQILSARNQLDSLVDRYSVLQDSGSERYSVHKDPTGRTRIAYDHFAAYPDSGSLPETLRSMQKDLYEACQQLARHESRAASETLQQQSDQLRRCEMELLQSVEKLIEERAALLRKIANEYQLSHEQLSLAFGNWCDCHNHSHLQDWLLNETPVASQQVGHDPLTRQRLLERIETIEAERRTAIARLEHCQRQLHDVQALRRGGLESQVTVSYRPLADIQRELDIVQSELLRWDELDRLRAESEELRQRLENYRPAVSATSAFRESVHRHIAGLMGGKRSALNSPGPLGQPFTTPQRRYDLVDGLVYDQPQRIEAEVPPALVRVAMRLAIAEAAAQRSEAVPVILDESLDQVPVELQRSAVTHLGQVARSGQQILVLTGEPAVAEAVHSHGGWLGHLHSQAAPVDDINRHLVGLANDYEANKWYQPTIQREPLRTSTPPRSEFYLTERSRVEESPSIDTLAAARCQAVGVDRIGDLLDVDPRWLAEQLRLDGVSESSVLSWQAEARLLCSVRQLRPFDARLLVAIGVRTPQQLADMHPSQLLDRVERFVSTDRGRRLLRSGSSYELSRITTWIASAKGGTSRHGGSSFNAESSSNYNRPPYPTDERDYESEDNLGYAYHHERETDFESLLPRSAQSVRVPRTNGSLRHSTSQPATQPAAAELRAPRVSQRSSRDFPSLNGARTERRRQRSETERPARESRRSSAAERRPEPLKLAQAEYAHAEASRLKFFLELSSPVVDAPSIGPRMAARMEHLGIVSVDQLLAANAESLAHKLNLRRIDATTIRSWQEQARLVCRIPNLRGHDAQLLVACNLTSPEELAVMNAASVLAQVTLIAESVDGQRILRGGKQPDLAEVKDWILWASQCRSLHAA